MSNSPPLPPQAADTERCLLRPEYPALAQLAAWCEHLADSHALSPSCAHAVDLCLSELVTNVIDYAYPAAGSASIVVDADGSDGTLTITLWDAGPAFNPLEAAPPPAPTDLATVGIGGLGIDLVRRFSRVVTYSREGGWNRLCFTPAGQ